MNVRLPFTDFFRPAPVRRCFGLLLVWLLSAIPVPAGYKSRPYIPLPIESYPSRLTSEGVTIAIEPMFTDALAAKAFDKKDMVARGIMPLAVVIFNSNEFTVEIEAIPIELLLGGRDPIRTVSPEEAIQRIFQEKRPTQVRIPSPIPLPRITVNRSNADALGDLKYKYLGIKRIEPKSLAAGFIYLPIRDTSNLRRELATAKIYIPDLSRLDTGDRMIFFEIDLKPAVDAVPQK